MAYSIEQDVDQILLSEQQIAQRVAELGAQITADYADRPLMLVGILKGAGIFHADLARAIKGRVQLDFMVASSYGSGAVSSGTLHIIVGRTFCIASTRILGEGIRPSSVIWAPTASCVRKSNAQP